MVQKYKKEEFDYQKIIKNVATISNLSFEQCTFEGGAIVQEEADASYQLVIEHVSLKRCKTGSTQIHGVRFKNVTVDTLRHPAIVFIGCVCERVVLRGNFGDIRFRQPDDEEEKRVLAPAAAAIYETVDWALDISEAKFTNLEILDIPGYLVVRDPETQFLIRRDAAAALTPDQIANLSTWAQIYVERAVDVPYETVVAAAPVRSKSFDVAMQALESLRELGIME